jgi:hypothetical protein
MKQLLRISTKGVILFLLTCSQLLTAQQVPDPKIYDAVQWRLIGPFRGGRADGVTGVKGSDHSYYFASTGGGIWKTVDSGKTWKSVSDGFFGGSMGAVAVAESDTSVVYAGGGEKTVRGNVSFGYGVWKSSDAGKTWARAGLDKSRFISRLRIHPTNPDVVYAAVLGDIFKPDATRGVFKSIDGGKNWEKVLFVSDVAGAVDLILDPKIRKLFMPLPGKSSELLTVWKVADRDQKCLSLLMEAKLGMSSLPKKLSRRVLWALWELPFHR